MLPLLLDQVSPVDRWMGVAVAHSSLLSQQGHSKALYSTFTREWHAIADAKNPKQRNRNRHKHGNRANIQTQRHATKALKRDMIHETLILRILMQNILMLETFDAKDIEWENSSQI